MLGEVVTLVGPARDDHEPISISIGHYSQEIDAQDALGAWTGRYHKAFDPSLIHTASEHEVPVQDGLAYYVRGASPITEYQYTNIRRGSLVWFIWASFGDSASPAEMAIYRRVVDSFRFGQGAPRGLRDVASSLPLSTNAAARGDDLDGLAAPASIVAPPPNVTDNWWAPVLKDANGTMWPITCGSPYHTNGAYYAADVAAPLDWPVYASRPGPVEFSGWDTSGYGYLVKIGPVDGVGKRHLYGHLNSINGPVVTGSSVAKGALLGKVGATGGASGVHLHFHIQSGLYQSSSNGISLVGMLGFADNANDPYYPSNDGVSHWNCAWMGR